MLIFSFCKGIIRNLACSGIDTNSLRVSATLQPAGFLATLALKGLLHPLTYGEHHNSQSAYSMGTFPGLTPSTSEG